MPLLKQFTEMFPLRSFHTSGKVEAEKILNVLTGPRKVLEGQTPSSPGVWNVFRIDSTTLPPETVNRSHGVLECISYNVICDLFVLCLSQHYFLPSQLQVFIENLEVIVFSTIRAPREHAIYRVP